MMPAMARLYLFLMLCLGMFGCIATNFASLGPGPGLGAGGREPRSELRGEATPAPSLTAVDREAQVAALRGSGNAIVLDRRSDGHFYADVEINGSTIEMLVDTGASGIALSENDARRVGIATSIGMRDEVGEGAGGTVYGDVVELGRVRLGDVEVADVTGVVLKGGNMSLLGQSFLSRFGKVEIAGDRMILRS